MRIVFSDFKRGEAKVKITNLDDLWQLSQIIDKEDVVKGETLRKIKVGTEKQDVFRKPVFLGIKTEKIEFQKQGDVLRVLGTIIEGPDDVPKGSHHTFNVELNSTITIKKERWYDYQVEKLKEAASENHANILLVVFDREEAKFALATSYGFEILSEIKGDVQKKDEDTKKSSDFYAEILKQINNYVEKYKIDRVVAASPAFWKDYLLDEIKDNELKKKIITATCSSTDASAFNEVLKRPEVETALKESRAVEEINLVEELLKEIMKGNLAKYGLKEVADSVEIGAARLVLISDSFIRKNKENNTFEEVEKTLRKADSIKAKIKIISSDNEGGKKLDGLGGIAAILRYQID